MRKVLLLIDSLGSGGAQRQIVGLAKLLKERDYDVRLIYYHPIVFYKSYLDEYGVKNECVRGAANKWKRVFKIYQTVRQYDPDVVISYLDGPNMIACVLRTLGLQFKLITSERNTTQKMNCRERLKFFLMRWADAIVANSYSQEAFIDKHYPVLSGRTSTITNFVDTESFSPRTVSNNNNIKKPLNILCVGRIAAQKNVLLFLEALFRLKVKGYQFHVDWYGDKDDLAYYTQCAERVKTLELEDVFSFRRPSKDIVKVYQEADVFCLPSVYEGLPNVLCEAMCCGLPILCSNVCDNPMLVKEGTNGFLFDPNAIDDIADKISKMLRLSVKELCDMGIKNREFAEQRFASSSFAEKYIELIR